MKSEGRVLVVEDDAALSGLIAEDLRQQGFDCVCVHSDRGACQALAAGGAFDALVTDINLGAGVTGFDVARLARQAQPGIRVIYLSGEFNARSWTAYGVPNSDYVSKPFALDLLAALLRNLPDGVRPL